MMKIPQKIQNLQQKQRLTLLLTQQQQTSAWIKQILHLDKSHAEMRQKADQQPTWLLTLESKHYYYC